MRRISSGIITVNLIALIKPKNLFYIKNIYFFGNMKKVCWFPTMALMMLFLITNIVTFSGIAEPWPTITIEAEPQAEVDVSPGSRCLTTVIGNVTCESTTPEDVIVRLSLSRSECRASISPPVMVFEGMGTETKELKVNISLSMKTSSYENPTATIIGTWTQGGVSSEVEPFTIRVIVLPFSKARIWSQGPEEVTADESIGFPIFINNIGNVDDLYRMEIVNRDELRKKGIIVETIEDISIEEGGSVELEVNVRTSSDTPLKVHRIGIVTTSLISGEPVVYEYSLYIRVKAGIVQILTSPLTLLLIAIVIITLIVVRLKGRKAINPPNPR